MRFMNEYDIDRAEQLYATHPVLGPAVQTLRNLVDWTNSNSDGWAYWPKPCRAAARLMEMIERDGTSRYVFDEEREDVTAAEYLAALRPIKSFRTRQNADFAIITTNVQHHAPVYGVSADLATSRPRRTMVTLYKTTIEIWSEYDGASVEIEALAREATDGSAICTQQRSEPIASSEAPEAVASFFRIEEV